MTPERDVGGGKRFESGPVTDRRCKDVMLQAERGDIIEIEGHCQCKITRVSVTYYGPKMILSPVDSDGKYMLTSPGPASQLMLWEPDNVSEGGFHSGYKQVGEVRAFIAEVGEYEFCPHCCENIRSIEHLRAAAFGFCDGQFDEDGKSRNPRELFVGADDE